MTPRALLLGSALTLLAACEPPIPDSAAGVGAGFDTPEQYQARREAQLRGEGPAIRPSQTVLPPSAPPIVGPGSVVAGGPAPLPAPAATVPNPAPGSTLASDAQDVAAQTRAILGAPPSSTVANDTTIASASAPLPQQTAPVDPSALDLDRDNPEISQEQDFEAVSAERDIEADAERLRAARQQYQLVRPTELQRPDESGPNIFAYAINDARPVGASGTYRRGPLASARRAEQRCLQYRSPDIAQEDFLAAGGPERDRLGLDPDGDGNACSWDPAVVRDLVQRG